MSLTNSEHYHRYKNRDWYKRSHRRAALLYQRAHVAAGLCRFCLAPVVTAYLCQKHRESQNAQNLARYYRKKALAEERMEFEIGPLQVVALAHMTNGGA